MEKTRIVTYKGGFNDGKCYRSDSPDTNEQDMANWPMSPVIGKRFRSVSDAAINHAQNTGETQGKMNHIYEVVECNESDTQIEIVCELKGQD